MKALLLLLLLPGCAFFTDPAKFTLTAPARLCIVGTCADLQPAFDDLDSRGMTARICAAGAATAACKRGSP